MPSVKTLAIVLVVLGALGLAYGGFTYTKSSHEGHIGSLELSVEHKKTVTIPLWASAVVLALGAGLLLVPVKK
jgi:TRAP-type C4-dicarboxylate transport system permease small subunit